MFTFSDIVPSGSWGSLAGSMKADVYVPMSYLCWSLAGIFGLVAALRVYALWNINGRAHLHIDAKVYAWIGAAIFFVLANAFIKSVIRA